MIDVKKLKGERKTNMGDMAYYMEKDVSFLRPQSVVMNLEVF